jgi:MFS transporter, ceroid-lipofuscinosis neuronal protein 7
MLVFILSCTVWDDLILTDVNIRTYGFYPIRNDGQRKCLLVHIICCSLPSQSSIKMVVLKSAKHSALLALSLVSVVDSISYMVVTPSLIFYINQVNGTHAQYGFILSAFSLASLCAKPVLGTWVDWKGNQFRIPYLCSIVVALLGGFLYFYASAYAEHTNVAIALITAGRILGGLGAANSALGYAYLASVIPPTEQTSSNTLLSMTRIIGLAAGPGFNVLLKGIDTSVTIGSKTIKVDPLNSVGLFLVCTNFLAFWAILLLLKDPGRKLTKKQSSINEAGEVVYEGYTKDEIGQWAFIKALFSGEILIQIFTIFVYNSNFQL